MDILLVSLFVCLLLAASIWDIATFRIPNWLTIPGFVVLAFVSAIEGKPILHFMLSAFLSFCILMVLFRVLRGRLGMGDVKLSLSIGGVLDGYYWLVSLIFASLLGLCFLVLKLWSGRRLDRESPIPFSPFLSIGAVIAYWMKFKGYEFF